MTTVIYHEKPIKLLGDDIKVGDEAPLVTLKGKMLADVQIGVRGKTQIIMSVPSLDTPVCEQQARDSNQRLASFKNIETIFVSMDLPFATDRFCATKDIHNLTFASDYAFRDFGLKYGVLLGEGILEGLLTRAVFVIKDGVIVYKQIVPNVMQKPDLKDLEDFLFKNYHVYPRSLKDC